MFAVKNILTICTKKLYISDFCVVYKNTYQKGDRLYEDNRKSYEYKFLQLKKQLLYIEN